MECWEIQTTLTRVCFLIQIETSGHMSVLRLSNLSSLDHNSKITCSAENIVGEKESSLLLDILCTFKARLSVCQQKILSLNQCWSILRSHIYNLYCLHSVPPKITKLSDAIPDHHWCIPFSVSGKGTAALLQLCSSNSRATQQLLH